MNRDIFNADGFDLFFNTLPNKSLVMNGETCHGGKHSKECLKVLVGANIYGPEKAPLLV
jgi:hypothetical protein